jgi:hypothetical protein
MSHLTSGAAHLGGAFVKDLAEALAKAPATLTAYLKKHLPASLTKRKNANNRLANFVCEEGVQALRQHYTPAESAKVSQELEQLREENARLRETCERLEAVVDAFFAEEERKEIAWEAKAEHRAEVLRKSDETLATMQWIIDDMAAETEKKQKIIQQYWRETNELRREIHPGARRQTRESKTRERETQRRLSVVQTDGEGV